MKTFIDMLNEDKGGKNLHLEHLEDEIINYGIDGGRAALNFLQSLRDMMAGSSRSAVNMTVKWDGAPAIFAGIDPEDDKFFVAKKAMKSILDIDLSRRDGGSQPFASNSFDMSVPKERNEWLRYM